MVKNQNYYCMSVVEHVHVIHLFLTDLFDITILFSNSNITPHEEYLKRLNTLKEYVKSIEKDLNTNIKIVEDSYEHSSFIKDLIPYKDEKEGGKRCEICIEKRIRRLFEYANDNNFNYVTTVMSISRNKNSMFINELGKKLRKNMEMSIIFNAILKGMVDKILESLCQKNTMFIDKIIVDVNLV